MDAKPGDNPHPTADASVGSSTGSLGGDGPPPYAAAMPTTPSSRGADAEALCALGEQMLFGDGRAFQPEAGVAKLREAAALGSGAATALLARLAAWGVLRTRDLQEALDGLQQAAERDWAPAQAELRFLAQGEGSDWAHLRARVNLRAWTTAPPLQRICDRPRVRVIPGFCSAAECAWLIARAHGHLTKARVYRGGRADLISHERTNSSAPLMVKAADIATALVRDRISAAISARVEHFEVAQVLHYRPGQTFAQHADFLDPSAFAEDIAQRGQRVATFLIYLNDDYEGGETEFPAADFRFKGRAGDALFFLNVDAAGEPDPASIHAGLPPTGSEKWALSQWVRRAAINASMTPGAAIDPLPDVWIRTR